MGNCKCFASYYKVAEATAGYVDMLIRTGTYPPLPSVEKVDFSLLKEEVLED